jgi:hypothetical protein
MRSHTQQASRLVHILHRNLYALKRACLYAAGGVFSWPTIQDVASPPHIIEPRRNVTARAPLSGER